MRQIHAAIEHIHRGDFECAITLAAAGEGLLPPTEEPHFRELKARWQVDDVVGWLRHGKIGGEESGKQSRGGTVRISEFEAILVIYRAITKFHAIFRDQKTPQMIDFRIHAGPHLQGA